MYAFSVLKRVSLLPPGRKLEEKHMNEKVGIRAFSMLLAVMLVSVVVPVTAIGGENPVTVTPDIVDAATANANEQSLILSDCEKQAINDLFKPIDYEIQDYVSEKIQRSETQQLTDIDVFAQAILTEYDASLDKLIDILDQGADHTMKGEEHEEFKKILVEGHINKVYIDEIKAKFGMDDQNATHLKPKLVTTEKIEPLAFDELYSTTESTPFIWVQTHCDVYGGSGLDDSLLPYIVNGGNDLYDVIVYSYPTEVFYQLCYYDEDHPSPITDAEYDLFRLVYYETLEDRALFKHVFSDNRLYLLGCWNSGMTYAWTTGIHGDKDYPYSACYFYVSNIWNHDIDKFDSNPSMSKVYYYY